jgi:hypothetical protein
VKSFLLAMLLGVSLSTAAVVAAARALLPETVWEQPPPTPTRLSLAQRQSQSQRASSEASDQETTPFTEQEALEVVGARFGASQKAEQLRQALRANGKVTYHSPQHWTVRLDAAAWTAHGPGRYADPENQPAELLEAQASR